MKTTVDHLILTMLSFTLVFPVSFVCFALFFFIFLSWMLSCQASSGIGGKPLLGKKGHGLVGGADLLAGNPLMQRHPLRYRDGQRE